MDRSLPEHLAAALDEIHDRARAQGGALRRSDLAQWGLEDAVLRALVRRAALRRLRHGIYAPTALIDAASSVPRLQHTLDLSAALLALDEPAYAFARSAALLHGLPLPTSTVDTLGLVRPQRRDHRALTRSERPRPRMPATRLLSHPLEADDVAVVDGIPTVCRELAAISSAATLPLDWAIGTLDAVLWRNEPGRERLAELVDQWPRLRGIGTVRRALPQARPGAQTILESLSRVRLMWLGLPEPQLQVPFSDEHGLIGYVDMYFPEFNVVGEADGAVKYSEVSDVRREKRREDRLRALGLGVVRWGFDDARAGMREVAEQIRRQGRRAA